MKIYCSGIGGIGLSAYAALRNGEGHTVAGSDRADSALLDDLREQGIEIFLSQDGTHVPEDADLFVYSEAIPEEAPERVKAKEYGIRQISYANALGEMSKDYRVIAVCGTHGKSSTVSMASRVLIDAGLDPSIVVGTKLAELNGRNWRAGKSDIFLLEACEYRCSFHYLSPDIILLLNADGDHFDAFGSLEEYQQAYRTFLKLLPEDGTVITHMSDPDCVNLVEGLSAKMVDIDQKPLAKMNTPGLHMQQNAQLVLGLADELSVAEEGALHSLSGYSGCWRRMEVKGNVKEQPERGSTDPQDRKSEEDVMVRRAHHDIVVIDDYAHHPLEITATLKALKEHYSDRRLVLVFQPHTHERTLSLYKDFVQSFSHADRLILTDVYEARSDIESEKLNIQTYGEDIAKESCIECSVGGSLEDIEASLREEILEPGDLLVCMGAGTITKLAEGMVS